MSSHSDSEGPDEDRFHIETAGIDIKYDGRSFTFRGVEVKIVDGDIFVLLRAKSRSWWRLLSVHVRDGGLFVGGCYNIIKQITNELICLRNAVALNCIKRGNRASKAKNFRASRFKEYRLNQAALPEVIEIVAPPVGDIPETSMRVVSCKGKGKKLYIQCTSANLKYLTTAVRVRCQQGRDEVPDIDGADDVGNDADIALEPNSEGGGVDDDDASDNAETATSHADSDGDQIEPDLQIEKDDVSMHAESPGDIDVARACAEHRGPDVNNGERAAAYASDLRAAEGLPPKQTRASVMDMLCSK